jgi:hypothetical protein
MHAIPVPLSMASIYHFTTLVSLFLLFSLPNPAIATARMFSLVKQQPVIHKYHNGPLLKGNVTVNLLRYGKFSPIQRSILVWNSYFLLTPAKPHTGHHSVKSWWSVTGQYKGGPCHLVLGKQFLKLK